MTKEMTSPGSMWHHPHHTPRGYYLLFILNGDGAPSEGKFIFLH